MFKFFRWGLLLLLVLALPGAGTSDVQAGDAAACEALPENDRLPCLSKLVKERGERLRADAKCMTFVLIKKGAKDVSEERVLGTKTGEFCALAEELGYQPSADE
jgi:hypothetical protein